MNTRELLFPPGATRHDWVLDGMLALAMFLVTVLPYASYSAWNTTPRMLLMVTLSLMVLPLVLRRHSPLLMLAGCTFAGIVQVIVVNTFTATLVVLPIVAYSVARWVPGVAARSVVAIGGFASIIGPLRWATATQGFTISARGIVLFVLASFVCLGLIVTPYAIGRRVRESSVAHADRIAAAEERYQLLLAEREQQARLAESRARATIARELHDIVAHSLSVMIVQAEGGRAVAAKRPEAAVNALDTIAKAMADLATASGAPAGGALHLGLFGAPMAAPATEEPAPTATAVSDRPIWLDPADLAKCNDCATCYQELPQLFEKATIVVDGSPRTVGRMRPDALEGLEVTPELQARITRVRATCDAEIIQ